MLKTVLWGVLLVATSLLNTNTKFYQNQIKIGRVISKILYAHICAYATNIIDFGPFIGQISIFLNKTKLYMKGKPKLHTLHEYQLNIYLTVDSVAKKSQKNEQNRPYLSLRYSNN